MTLVHTGIGTTIAVRGERRVDTANDLRRVYRTTLADVFGYLLFHTAGDHHLAEDLTAETYLHAARHFRAGRHDEVTLPWLKTVAKRRLVDHWRQQGSVRRRVERLRSEMKTGIDADPDRDPAEEQAVYEALRALPDDQRLVLVLKHLDGLPVNEIAEMIGRTPKATESLLGRARDAFRRRYGGEDHG